MEQSFRLKTALILLVATLGLAGCESDEEKAERYFQSGLALLEAGDKDRALVEFRNVFQHDGFHKEARETYASVLMEQGEIGQAVSQYLRLVELYPDTIDARVILARTAILSRDWEEAERHTEAAQELAPDAEEVAFLSLALNYRNAVREADAADRAAIADEARQRLDDGAVSLLLTLVAVDFLTTSDTPMDALPYIDAGLENHPDQIDLHVRKFRLLSDAGQDEAAGAQLQRMAQVFPENAEISDQLILWHLNQDDLNAAESVIRDLANADGAGTAEKVTLVQFLLSRRGVEAATAELDALVAESEDAKTRNLYNRLYATLDYESGQSEKAVTRLENMLADESISVNDRTDTQVLLARIHDNTRRTETAQSLVAEVLETDPGNTDALKMRANWHIDDGDTRAAIIDLRAALNENPRDPETLTLMAQAHQREGNSDLASERLALAVEVSGEAAPQSLRYAAFLMEQDRPGVASTVLRAASRRDNGNADLLNALAAIYLTEQDWVRAQGIADQLRSLNRPQTDRDAQFLQAAILSGQNRTEESLSFLQNQIASGTGNADAFRKTVLIVQNFIRSGRLDSAIAFVADQMAQTPDSVELTVLQASLFALNGNHAEAEKGYRTAIAAAPQAQLPVRLLLTLLFATDRAAEAIEVLDSGLQRIPENVDLNWIKASLLEQEGDIPGAIKIYEALYDLDTSNVVVANNLASMLVAQRDDAETVERAFLIARRLRDAPVPQFQDTYGWIQHLRGNSADALPHLQRAVAQLPDHPQVNYHLGTTYAAVGQVEDARRHLQRAIELADQSAPQLARDARAKLESLP